jgi:hypothetical protein
MAEGKMGDVNRKKHSLARYMSSHIRNIIHVTMELASGDLCSVYSPDLDFKERLWFWIG